MLFAFLIWLASVSLCDSASWRRFLGKIGEIVSSKYDGLPEIFIFMLLDLECYFWVIARLVLASKTSQLHWELLQRDKGQRHRFLRQGNLRDRCKQNGSMAKWVSKPMWQLLQICLWIAIIFRELSSRFAKQSYRFDLQQAQNDRYPFQGLQQILYETIYEQRRKSLSEPLKPTDIRPQAIAKSMFRKCLDSSKYCTNSMFHTSYFNLSA